MTLSQVWKSATFLVACEISAYILSNSVRALNPQKSLNIEVAAQSYSHRVAQRLFFPLFPITIPDPRVQPPVKSHFNL